MTESLGISIQSMCYQCQALNELCPECQDIKDTRDTVLAHQIVDESDDYINLGYGARKRQVANGGAITEGYRALSVIRDLPSGHDWTERDEFLPQIAMLVDRLYDLETSLHLTPAEVICQDCHLVYNKWSNCPNCY